MEPEDSNDLKVPSVIRTFKLVTLSKSIVQGELGNITEVEYDDIVDKIRERMDRFQQTVDIDQR
ncbi:MAG: hypothetical protein SH856_08330 [Flavobacteriales bacterium]|nr:hypothetical protein [Flavobacteriales bacterium]